MEEKSNKDTNIVLYLNMKLFNPSQDGIIYNNSFIKEIKTFFEKRAFVTITNKNEIKAYKEHSSTNSKVEKILFQVEIVKNKIRLVKTLGYRLLDLTIGNINKINNLIYKVIDSDYNIYLKEKDIINFGGYNYIIQEININDEKNSHNNNYIDNKPNKANKDNKDNNSILDFYPKDIKTISCDICNQTLVKLCKCQTYEHLDFIKEKIKNIGKPNNKNTVITYKFNLYKCNICDIICPLKFKPSKNETNLNIENEFYDVDEFIEKPKKDFIILEFLGKENKENEKLIDKYIYVIKLTEEEILIGKGKDGNIVIDDNENIDEIYSALKFDKNDKKLYIKNKNENYNTYIVIKDKLEIHENEISIKADRVLMKAKLMKKEDLEKIKNEKSIYPLEIIEKDY